MYERLIPEVLRTFSAPGESERAFLGRVQQADMALSGMYRTCRAVSADPYAQPITRAAYLLRYLGHYTLQLGDLLTDLEGSSAGPILWREHLRVAALCGGPCPEAIALDSLHAQAGGQRITVQVLDRHARTWSDCWPIAEAIAADYPEHPEVTIDGIAIDLLQQGLSGTERRALNRAHVFTAMNCLNELMGAEASALRRGLQTRLAALPAGALVLASDQSNYPASETGLRLLHELLLEAGAEILLAELDRQTPHKAQNRFTCPQRIAWMYGEATCNIFRIWTKQLRLAAVLP